eukprot:m.257739 g.257739  ORF g.257739 m.257739 type:complete len:608 (-) comp35653_c0_seq1:175-1998(-)
MMMERILALVAAVTVSVHANMYDVVLPEYTAGCSSGCVAWANAASFNQTKNQPFIDAMFIGGADGAKNAGSSCAMPGAHAGDSECDCGQKDNMTYIYDSYAGPWCFCQTAPGLIEPLYCTPAMKTPEQINLQLAAPGVIVVGFVTYEAEAVTNPPMAMYGIVGQEQSQVTGVTHKYAPPGRDGKVGDKSFDLPYNMHYIRLQVQEHQSYTYKVLGGTSNWSATFTFRAPAETGITRVATYGDMGHSHYNCMENVLEDAKNRVIDAVVHMGDHCYNLGFTNDRRGDAYMNAFQPALTTVPWFPIIGNHEASDGDHFKHYQAIAFSEAYGVNPDTPFPGAPPLHSTATTALGAHLSQGTFYGMGLHGSVPSNTSRYASTTIGLIHMVGLDLNNLDAGQLAWLEEDLAMVNENRAATPWIMVMSHFPIWHSKTQEHSNFSAAHYVGDELLDNYAIDGENMDFVPCEVPGCLTIKQQQLKIGEALQPIFKKYGVDIYNAGHVHSYESTWPLCDFTTGEICNGEQDFLEPKGTVHITEGNGGVPGVLPAFGVKSCSTPGGFCRMTGTGGAYARITAFNDTHLTYDHVQNNGGNVTDTFTIVQHGHGTFTHMK